MSFGSDSMDSIQPALVGLSSSDARSALYYLSRYLKQAALFAEYGKDIFDDDQRAAPGPAVKQSTLAMIALVEQSEGAPAARFDDDTYFRWADHVEAIEGAIQANPSPEEVARAAQFLESIVLPDHKRR
jgi:hypothetical protein